MGLVQDLAILGFNEQNSRHLGYDVQLAATATGNNSQSGAFQLTANVTAFSTVTAAANSAKLPLAGSCALGLMIVRNDDSADAINLFPATGDNFNALAANASISLSAGFSAICRRVTNTRWIVNIVDMGAILMALSALGTGLVAKTATDTFAARTLTGPAAGITVSNGSGVSGNPTLALANDLAALEGLASNGIIARTATDTMAVRTITAPAAGITVSNGDGVSGNPTLALANDLSALEGLASTGIAVRSASDTWVQRSVAGTSLFTTVTNGSGVSGNPTIDLDAEFKAGWISAAETWTRTSNTTFTISGDLTGKYQKGHKIRWKDGGAYKYAYIQAVSHAAGTTTATLNAGSDYVMAAATITDNYYSVAESPIGFPTWFSYTPTFGGFSADPTGNHIAFRMIGRTVHLRISMGAGTSNATTFTATGPMAAGGSSTQFRSILHGVRNNSVDTGVLGLATIDSGSSTVNFYRDAAATGWTNVGTKKGDTDLFYEA